MRKAMVAIGVDRTASAFPPLQAAAKGADEIVAWGRGQGVECTLLTDAGGSRVRQSDVYEAVDKIVASGVYSQLIVYFSGHGVLQAPDCEVWLLSGAPDNPNESINVNGSIARSRTCGIEHVVVISDACRSLPANLRVGMLSPGVIFPTKTPRKPLPEVDVFYATLPGDPALEVPPDEAIRSHRGLLTQCLIEALQGREPTVVQLWQDGAASRQVVPSRPLRMHLANAVPEAAAAVSIALKQDPDVRVESALPKFLSDVTESAEPARSLTGLGASEDRAELLPGLAGTIGRFQSRLLNDPTPFMARTPNLEAMPDPVGLRGQMSAILDAKGRVSFETRTGFTVHGVGVRSAVVTGTGSDVFEEAGAFQVRVHEDYRKNAYVPRAALIRFADGRAVVLCVLPGYVGTVVVENGRVVTVNYTPARGSRNYREYEHVAEQLELRRAFVAVAARHGSFRPDRGPAARHARYLRVLKRVDPTLGIYAAYAYAQAGDARGVESVFQYMRDEPEPVPFDVAMLALQSSTAAQVMLNYPPWMPMLTQGWTLLGRFEDVMPPILRTARQHLLPSLWSTFAPEGADMLETAFGREP
ncbi:hypothetical protein [Methylibium sp.]|uniref:hypothetical protein n=1 Tax=Methylibium sp. TaxID=2067992 RepID=UPI003D10F106